MPKLRVCVIFDYDYDYDDEHEHDAVGKCVATRAI
jgi:hypothetical protein